MSKPEIRTPSIPMSRSKQNGGKFVFIRIEMASRGASYQRKYQRRLKKTNNINKEFMAYASEHAPDLVREFFESKAVIIPFLLI